MSLVSAVTATTPAFAFTEHNRAPISLDYEQIENTVRTADGTMRKFVIAKKKSFTLSWSMLPSDTALTVDGKPGAGAIKNFYDTYFGSKIVMGIKHHQQSTTNISSVTAESVNVFITSFSYEIVKRMPSYDYVNVSISFVEA